MKNYKYLAGIIDADGCINIHNYGNKYYSLRVIVGTTSKELVFWLYENFGGGTHFHKQKNEKWADVWTWYIGSSKAADLLKKILPYLVIKTSQAKLALRFQETMKCCPAKGISSEIMKTRQEIYLLMKQLNKTGRTK